MGELSRRTIGDSRATAPGRPGPPSLHCPAPRAAPRTPFSAGACATASPPQRCCQVARLDPRHCPHSPTLLPPVPRPRAAGPRCVQIRPCRASGPPGPPRPHAVPGCPSPGRYSGAGSPAWRERAAGAGLGERTRAGPAPSPGQRSAPGAAGLPHLCRAAAPFNPAAHHASSPERLRKWPRGGSSVPRRPQRRRRGVPGLPGPQSAPARCSMAGTPHPRLQVPRPMAPTPEPAEMESVLRGRTPLPCSARLGSG